MKRLHGKQHGRVGDYRAQQPAQTADSDSDRKESPRAQPLEPAAGQIHQWNLDQQHENPHISNRPEVSAARAHEERKQPHRSMHKKVSAQRENQKPQESAIVHQLAPIAPSRAQRDDASIG